MAARRPLRFVAFALVVVAAWLAPGRVARANMARSEFDGDRFGVLRAQRDTDVAVAREDLVFELAAWGREAKVTATYAFVNPSGAARRSDVAFVHVLGDSPHKRPPPTVRVDGAPVEYSTTTDIAVVRPALRAWVEARPAIRRELEAIAAAEAGGTKPGADRAALRARVVEAGVDPDVVESLARYWLEVEDAHERNPEYWAGVVLDVGRKLVPEVFAEMERGWTTLPGRRLEWLVFPLEIPAGGTAKVEVVYAHAPGADYAARVNPTYVYEYLLSPAATWARFDAIHVEVRVPEDHRFDGPEGMRREGGAWVLDRAGLPQGELVFRVMSREGLWFGLETPGGYWAIVLGLLAGALGLVAYLGGKAWSRGGRGFWSGTKHVLGIAAAWFALAVAVEFVFGKAAPSNALGFGYGDVFGLALFDVLGLGLAPLGARLLRR